MAAALHTFAGRTGLRLRTELGVRTIPVPLANLGGATGYDSVALLEAAEAGRVIAELALDAVGTLCLAADDGTGDPITRAAGEPGPQYTLYRLAQEPLGGEPQVDWPPAERLESMWELFDSAEILLLAEPQLAAEAEEDCAAAARWTIAQPRLAAQASDPFDSAAGWTLAPIIDAPVPGTGSTEPLPPEIINSGNTTYPEPTGSDWVAAAGWRAQARLWLSSHGPFELAGSSVLAWTTLHPGIKLGCHIGPPEYQRTAAGGAGELITAVPGNPQDTVFITSGQIGWDAAGAWTLFCVARAHALPTATQCLFAANLLNDPAQLGIELHGGTTTGGMRAVCGASSRTFATPLPTTRAILELSAPAGASVHAWQLAINGVDQTEASHAGTGPAPAWSGPYPARFYVFGGVGAANFRGGASEFILIQTADPAIRAAVRSYLATKFAITLP